MEVINKFETLNLPAPQAAQRLLGSILETKIDGQSVQVKIVETEAYDQTDEASHAYKGKTKRAATMFKPAGHLYVYFTWGMHYCCNIVSGPAGFGSGALIRAVEPIEGLDTLRGLQPHKKDKDLTNGPAKLCKILGIDQNLNGHHLVGEPLKLILKNPLPKEDIITTTRIGIKKAPTKLWRFYIKDNQFVSAK